MSSRPSSLSSSSRRNPNNNNSNNIMNVRPTSSVTTNNRFLAFPADISLASDEKRMFKVAKESEDFNNLSEKEKTKIKLERGAATLTVDSVASDLRKKRNAAAAELRREMLKREGIPFSTLPPKKKDNNSNTKSEDDDDDDDDANDNNNGGGGEYKEKLDEAVINSMNFPIHCDDDEPIAWKGPPIEFLEMPDELSKAERDAQERDYKHHQLSQNGKYWMSVYATKSKKPNPKLSLQQRQLLHQKEQNEKKPGILTGRTLAFNAGEAEFISRKEAKTEASIKKQMDVARKKREEEAAAADASKTSKKPLAPSPPKQSKESRSVSPSPRLLHRSISPIIGNDDNDGRNSPSLSVPPLSEQLRPSTSARSRYPTAQSCNYEAMRDRAWLIKLQKEKEMINEIQSKYQTNEQNRARRLQAVADRPQQIRNERSRYFMKYILHIKFVEALHLALRKKASMRVLARLFADPVRIWIARRKELKKVLKESRFSSFSGGGGGGAASLGNALSGDTDENNKKQRSPSRRSGSPVSEYHSDDDDDGKNSNQDDDDDDNDNGGRSPKCNKGGLNSNPSMMNMNLLRASFEQNLVDAKRLDATFQPFAHKNSVWTDDQLREMKYIREEETKKRAPLSVHELMGCSLARGLVSASSMEESTKRELLEKMRALFVPVWTPPQNEQTEKHRDAVLCPELLNAQDHLVYVRRGALSLQIHFDMHPDTFAIRTAETSFENQKKQVAAKFFEENPTAAAIESEKRKQAMLNLHNSSNSQQQTLLGNSALLSTSTASQSMMMNNNNNNVIASDGINNNNNNNDSMRTPRRPPPQTSRVGATANARNNNVTFTGSTGTSKPRRPATVSATSRNVKKNNEAPQHPFAASLKGSANHKDNNNSSSSARSLNQQISQHVNGRRPQQHQQNNIHTNANHHHHHHQASYLAELEDLIAEIAVKMPNEGVLSALRYSLPSLIEMEQNATENAAPGITGHFLRHLAMIDLSNYFPIESFPLLFPTPKMEITTVTETRENPETGETEWFRFPRLKFTSGAVPPLGFFGTRRCVFEGKGAASAAQYEPPTVPLSAYVTDPPQAETVNHYQKIRAGANTTNNNNTSATTSSSKPSSRLNNTFPFIPHHVCSVRSGDRAMISYSLVPDTSVDFFIAPIAEVKKLISTSLPWYIVARQVELMKLLGVECTMQSGHAPYSSAQSLAAEGEQTVASCMEEQTSTSSTRMSAIPRPADITRFTFMAQQKTREALISLASETALLTQQDWSNEANWFERISPNLSVLETIAQRSASLWNTLRREDMALIKNLPADRMPSRYTTKSEHGEIPVRYLPHSLQDARRRAANVWNDLVLSALESVRRLENGATFPSSDGIFGGDNNNNALNSSQNSTSLLSSGNDDSEGGSSSDQDDFAKTIHRENKAQQQKRDKQVEEKMKNIMSATFEKPLLDQYNGMNAQVQNFGGIELFEPGTTIKRRRDKNSGRALVVIRGVVITEQMKEENGNLVPIRNSAKYYFRTPTCTGLRNDARVTHALFQGMRRQFNFPGLATVCREIERNGLMGSAIGSTPLFTPDLTAIENRQLQETSALASLVAAQTAATTSGTKPMITTGASLRSQQHPEVGEKHTNHSPGNNRSQQQNNNNASSSTLSKVVKYEIEKDVISHATNTYQFLMQNVNNGSRESRVLAPNNLNPIGPIPVINAGSLLKNHPPSSQTEVVFAKSSVLVLHVPWKAKLRELMAKHGLILPQASSGNH